VYYAGQNQAIIGLLISVALFSVQILWQYRIVRDTRHLVNLLIILTLCGTLIDSAMIWLDLFIYTDNYFYPYLCPPWMMMLWLEFALIVHALLKPYWDNYILIGFCSLGGFPLAYLVGARLAAITFVHSQWTVILLGLVWMWLLPALTYYHHRRVLSC